MFAAFFSFMMRFGCGAHMVHGHVGGRGHGSDSGVGGATDPVCGMAVVADQGYTKMHPGQPYRFCSRACLDQFEANPDKYLTKAEVHDEPRDLTRCPRRWALRWTT
jgi:YHS domain-containing protein